jgi:hypothetical protein
MGVMKIYIALFCFSLCLTGCSKDFLKSYDERILGTWQLTDVDRVGFGGNTANLPFTGGTFIFKEGGILLFTDPSGTLFNGTWDIEKKSILIPTVDADGNAQTNLERVRTLDIVAVNFASQVILSEHFDEMEFKSTNRFKAKLYAGSHSYVFTFKRN